MTFQVLSRQTDLFQNHLLEASAGTGKTFSIQNIVARLLLESQNNHSPFILSRILVVTFTRAATRDLRLRIRANLDQILKYWNTWMEKGIIEKSMPDYLQALAESSNEDAGKIRQRLQQALFSFDQAQIFTIHSFCSRMLFQFPIEGDIGFTSLSASGEDPLPLKRTLEVVKNYLRSELRPDSLSPAQLGIILNRDPSFKNLINILKSGYTCQETLPFSSHFKHFQAVMKKAKEEFSLSSTSLLQDFQSQCLSYKNEKGGLTKAETLMKIEQFASLFDLEQLKPEDFDLLIKDGLVWTRALNSDLKKQTPKSNSFQHHPNLTDYFKHHLEPIINEARSFPYLISRMANECITLFQTYQREEELLSPDDLLKKMASALEHPSFIEQVRSSYDAVIIDEFQDTDPIQWQIFRTLFLPDERAWPGFIYLVGDPKQSIYSFRQADIYTYLTAAHRIGHKHCHTLNVNFRSQRPLVNALNALFHSDSLPEFIPLPKIQKHLPYPPVEAAPQSSTIFAHRERGAIHFIIGDGRERKKNRKADLETDVFFPFIAKEILDIHFSKQMKFKEFAVLVRDRHQALRLAQYLGMHKIPYVNQRSMSLVDSPAFLSLISCIKAILNPKDLGVIKTALSSTLIGWTHRELLESASLESILFLLQQLQALLREKDWLQFFQIFLQSCWKNDSLTLTERLLFSEGGLEIYRDLIQIADLIAETRFTEWHEPEGIVSFLYRLSLDDNEDDARIKRFQDPSADGVHLLTLHSSKGLEFPIVFSLGLIQRRNLDDDLAPVEMDGKVLLTPLKKGTSTHHHICEENDAEKMRQLYVSLTRAKLQLYIPVLLSPPCDAVPLGTASPMDLFVARLMRERSDYLTLYERIANETGDALLHFLNRQTHQSITFSIHTHFHFEAPIRRQEPLQIEIQKPKKILLKEQSISHFSFTSLVNKHSEENSFNSTIQTPKDFFSSMKNSHTLPCGYETGILIHEILEKLKFSDYCNPDSTSTLLQYITTFTRHSQYSGWEEVITKMIDAMIHTPIQIQNSIFKMVDLNHDEMYREMPFMHPYNGGYMKGVIDLIFRYKDRYFIVDWKTNWLGMGFEDYTFHKLELTMHKNDYHLQGTIYKEAFRKYHHLIDKRPFEECFGGVIYLFLRGIQKEYTTGIYHYNPLLNSDHTFSSLIMKAQSGISYV